MVEMARFLSPEWLDLLAAAAGGGAASDDEEPGASCRFAIRQVVTGGPDGDVDYVVVTDAGRVSVHRGDGVAADVDVVQDYATASAISQGQLSPSVAFAGGRLELAGTIGLLARHHGAFTRLGELFAQVRAQTTY